MKRYNQDIYLAPGLWTPFGRGGGAYDAISLSGPVVNTMVDQLKDHRPDLFLWGTVFRICAGGVFLGLLVFMTRR